MCGTVPSGCPESHFQGGNVLNVAFATRRGGPEDRRRGRGPRAKDRGRAQSRRVACGTRPARRSGTTRTFAPVYGASTMSPPPMYIATWWIGAPGRW